MSHDEILLEDKSQMWDIWSLGRVFFFICTFECPSQTEFKDINVTKLLGHYSQELVQLIRLMTNTDPEKRPTAPKINKIIAGLIDLAWATPHKHLGRPILHYQEDYLELKTLSRFKNLRLVQRACDNQQFHAEYKPDSSSAVKE